MFCNGIWLSELPFSRVLLCCAQQAQAGTGKAVMLYGVEVEGSPDSLVKFQNRLITVLGRHA